MAEKRGGMTEKMRGVFEKPKGSGVWWINYYDREGHRHREKVGRQKVAEQAYIVRRREIEEGRFFPPRRTDTLSFRELAAKRMEAKKQRLAARSYATDENRLKKLNAAFGDLPARQISAGKIETFLRHLLDPHQMGKGRQPRGAAKSTANRYRSLLSSIFAFGLRDGLVEKNPVRRVERMREPTGRVRFLDIEEENAVRAVAAAGHAGHAWEMDLAIHTGMRRDEQWGLRWQDIDLDNSLAAIRGKGERPEYVRLNGTAKNALIKLNEISNGSPFVSPDKRRADQGDFRRWFEDACVAAKVDGCCWHTMRHTFVSRLVMSGVDIVTVQKLARHRSIQTTLRYAHLSHGHEQAAVDRLVRGWHPSGTEAPKEKGDSQQSLQFQSSGP